MTWEKSMGSAGAFSKPTFRAKSANHVVPELTYASPKKGRPFFSRGLNA